MNGQAIDSKDVEPLVCHRCGETILDDKRDYDGAELVDATFDHWDKCSPGWEDDQGSGRGRIPA